MFLSVHIPAWGTLSDHIMYPLSREEAELKILTLYIAGDRSSASELLDDFMMAFLVNVRLVYLLEREGWDSTPNWEDVLSLEEQQRLGMKEKVGTLLQTGKMFYRWKNSRGSGCATSVDVEEHLSVQASN